MQNKHLIGILITGIMGVGSFFRAGTKEICHLPEKKKREIAIDDS